MVQIPVPTQPDEPAVAHRLGSALDVLEVMPRAVEIASTAPAAERPAMVMVGAVVLALARTQRAAGGSVGWKADPLHERDAPCELSLRGWELVELSQSESPRAVRGALEGLVARGWLDPAFRSGIDRLDGDGLLETLHLVPGPALLEVLDAFGRDGDRPTGPIGH